MKILFVAHSFPRHADDAAGSFLLSLAGGLIRRGHSVMAVVPHHAGLAERDDIGGVAVLRFRYGSDSQETLAYVGTMADQVLRSWGARWRLVRFIVACRTATARAVAEFRPDIIHVHWWFPNGVALLWKSLLQVPKVVTSHGTDLFLLDRVRVMRTVAARVFGGAARVTVISTPLVSRAVALGVEASRIAVIPMPVSKAVLPQSDMLVPDLSVHTPVHTPVHIPVHTPETPVSEQTPALLFVGRLTERKGAEYAIRALALLMERGVAAKLIIAGDGPLRLELDALCDELRLGSRVTFTGMVSPGEVASLMRTATVFVMPAVTDWKGEQEGFGMVIVEAMMAGLPVVASRSGGITDIIVNSESGILVPERDAGAIADAVELVIHDSSFASTLSEGGRRRALERFHPDTIAQQFEDVYLSAR